MLTTKNNVLICDSDINLTMVLADYLLSRDYAVETVADGAEAVEKIRTNKFNMCLLDLNLPTKNGFEVLAEVRHANNAIPVIVVTSRTSREDMIRAFELGCDDYVVKPFSMEVLICRIQAVSRRYMAGVDTTTTVFDIAGKTFDSVHQTFDGKHMSSRESDLLLLLCRNMNQLVDRHLILGSLWKNDDYFASRSLSVYINHLRKFLSGTGYRIIGVHGKGYKLVDAE
ncbi:MAG: response regulator transcription factor [Paludibacteraceae bacterium]